jgi:hypothetical protein
VRLSIRSCDLVGVAAISDRLHAVFELQCLEVRNRTAAHHASPTAHVTHLAAALSRGRCVPRLGCVFKERQQVGALLSIVDSRKSHGVSGYQVLRVLEPLVQCLVPPRDARQSQGRGISREALEAAGFPVPESGKARPRRVAV